MPFNYGTLSNLILNDYIFGVCGGAGAGIL